MKSLRLSIKIQRALNLLFYICLSLACIVQLTFHAHNAQRIRNLLSSSKPAESPNLESIATKQMQILDNDLTSRFVPSIDPLSNTLCAHHHEDTNKCRLSTCSTDSSSASGVSHYGYAGQNFTKSDRILGNTKKLRFGGVGWENGCVISHKYKFIYLHVWKSGGTAIKSFLRKGLCGFSQPGDPCPEGPESFSMEMTCIDMVKKYPHYFTWTLARNPFSRMFSAYSMSLAYAKSYIRFETFVLNKVLRKKSTRMSKYHYLPQEWFLFDENNCPIFDFLGRLEHVEEDMSYVLEKIDSPELKRVFLAQNKTILKLNTRGQKRRQQFHGDDLNLIYENDALRRTVAEEFANDFRLLGYNPNVVPNT